MIRGGGAIRRRQLARSYRPDDPVGIAQTDQCLMLRLLVLVQRCVIKTLGVPPQVSTCLLRWRVSDVLAPSAVWAEA
jgi:hypothetical protein